MFGSWYIWNEVARLLFFCDSLCWLEWGSLIHLLVVRFAVGILRKGGSNLDERCYVGRRLWRITQEMARCLLDLAMIRAVLNIQTLYFSGQKQSLEEQGMVMEGIEMVSLPTSGRFWELPRRIINYQNRCVSYLIFRMEPLKDAWAEPISRFKTILYWLSQDFQSFDEVY